MVKIGKATIKKTRGHEIYNISVGKLDITVWELHGMLMICSDKPITTKESQYATQKWVYY